MFLCVIVYRLFVLNFWWHRHREYQLVAKSTVPCFLTRVIFTMSVFPLWYAPAVPPELGRHNANLGASEKKISGASRRNLCPNFKTVSAPMGACNLKQFDGLTRLTFIPLPRFYDRSTSLGVSTTRGLNSDQAVQGLSSDGKSFVGKRKKFVFNAFIDFKPGVTWQNLDALNTARASKGVLNYSCTRRRFIWDLGSSTESCSNQV